MIQENVLQNDVIYLIYCSLNKISPDKERIKKMNLFNIYKFSKAHSITAIVYNALEVSGIISDNEDMTVECIKMLSQWKHDRDRVIFINTHMDIEREKILGFMEQKGIWYVPLKGIILRHLYPSTEMRQMGDNDILYDKKYQEDLYEFMLANKYEAEEYKESNHDTYIKRPMYNFEMHTSLFNDKNTGVWNNYYNDIIKRLVKDEDKQYGYHFTDEDFYIYLIIHMMKHFDEGGIGIRAMIDCYLYIKEYNYKLDWSYINSELETLGISDFEKKIKVLSSKMFSNIDGLQKAEISADEAALLKYIFYSGTYGGQASKIIYNVAKLNSENKKPNKKGWKIKYLWKRVFPEKEFMMRYYPTAYKYKVLIPFVYVQRIFKGIFQKKRHGYLKQELKTVLKQEKTK